MSEPEKLTVTMFRSLQGVVVRLHDNMTPTQEIRYVQMILTDHELATAASPGIAWYRYVKCLVEEFNKLGGKKVKLLNTFDLDYHEHEDIIPLPYSMGLIYYSDNNA